MGDSHSEHLFLGIAEQLPQVNVGFYAKGALPFLSKDEFKLIFERVLKDPNIKQVVVSAMWAGRVKEVSKDTTFDAELGRAVKALQDSGKKVYLSNDLPQFEFDPQRCKFERPLTQSTKCDVPKKAYEDQLDKYTEGLMAVRQSNTELEWIDLSALMCNQTSCSMARNGQVLYRDNNHLNIPGSQYVGAQIVAHYPRLAQLRAH
jgi:hypothetical protein